MECGIFAVIGVLVGALITKKDLKIGFKPKKRGGKTSESEESLTVAEQWENLLRYDGKIK